MTHVPRGRRGLPTWSTCATPHEGYRRAARKLFESTYPDSPRGCGADALAVDKLNVASIAKLGVPMGRGADALGRRNAREERATVSACMSLDEPTARRAAADPMVDVVFDVAGTALPREHRAALRDALATWLPWLADDAHIGIHPLKATTIDGDTALLSKRSRLVLRVGASRVAAVRALRGHDLNVGGHSIRLAEERVKPLAPSATL